jgi:hypothetical protein
MIVGPQLSATRVQGCCEMKGVRDFECMIGSEPGGSEEHGFGHRNGCRADKGLSIALQECDIAGAECADQAFHLDQRGHGEADGVILSDLRAHPFSAWAGILDGVDQQAGIEIDHSQLSRSAER